MKHQITCYNHLNKPSKETEERLVSFLYTHLDQFGDPKEDIQACLDYVFCRGESFGGFVLALTDEGSDALKGVVVINHTGMSRYIPANLLVYIAVDARYRGQGVGSTLINEVFSMTEGGIALHCEPNNPARKLYEKLGFKSKYLEMRR